MAVVAKATLLGTLSSGITMRNVCITIGLWQSVSANGTYLLKRGGYFFGYSGGLLIVTVVLRWGTVVVAKAALLGTNVEQCLEGSRFFKKTVLANKCQHIYKILTCTSPEGGVDLQRISVHFRCRYVRSYEQLI